MAHVKKERIQIIDGLRGVAVLMVVLICHYIGNHFEVTRLSESEKGRIIWHLADLSVTGVHLFFIISGFLLGGILLDHRGSRHFFSAFYVRRLTRILPLYFGGLVLFVIVAPTLDERFEWLIGEPLPVWSYFVFLQNNAMALSNNFGGNWLAPTWSLAVEEQFYIILPFLILLTPPRHLPKLLIAGVLLAPFFRAAAGLGISGAASVVLLTSCMDALCYGILAAYAVRSAPIRDMIRANIRKIGSLGWLFLLLGFMVSYLGDSLDIGARVVVGYWLITTGYTALLLYVTQHSGTWLHHLLAQGWLRWIGVRCYAIYLFHEAVIGLLGGFLAGRSDFVVNDFWTFGVWMMAIASIIILADLSWRWIERPMIAFGHRWTYQDPIASTQLEETITMAKASRRSA